MKKLATDREAEPILDAARTLLVKDALRPSEQTRLARAYARALGQVDAAFSRKRFEELFAEVRGTHDTFTTSPFYNLSQLEVAEAVVLALSGE
jgi:hypothetical protein